MLTVSSALRHLDIEFFGIKLPTLRSFFKIIEPAYYVLFCCQDMVLNVIIFFSAGQYLDFFLLVVLYIRLFMIILFLSNLWTEAVHILS